MVQACPGRGTQVKDFNLDFIFQNVLFFNMGNPEDDARVREMFGIQQNAGIGLHAPGVQGAQRRRYRLYAQMRRKYPRELGKHGAHSAKRTENSTWRCSAR